MNEIKSPILNAIQACDYLGITIKTRVQTITEMARSGKLKKCQKVGKEWRFHIEGLQDYFLVNGNASR